jgi:hypothetical protein
MGGQPIERREVIRFMAVASMAAAFPGFQKWSFAGVHDSSNRSVAQSTQPYKPSFFSPPQFEMAEHLAEMIIPADDKPGAKAAGVAEFIDFMLANRVSLAGRDEYQSFGSGRIAITSQQVIRLGEDAQGQFILGLQWLNGRSRSEFGHEFMDCSADQQISLLKELAYVNNQKPATDTGRQFFLLLRDYTVVGYYTSKVGLESLGYPGLRVVWPKMPGCSHPDDPEHAHLRPSILPRSSELKISLIKENPVGD